VEKVNGGGLAVTVEDQGKGFEVGHKTEVAFDHFGLAAVRQRMEWIGGRLDVTSSPGQGTRATLVLPTQ
jgi:signal transduction histidine kinase